MIKKAKPAKETEELNAETKTAEPSELEESFSTGLDPVENKSIRGIINNFSVSCSEDFSKYLGKKVDFEFKSMDFLDSKDAIEKLDHYIFSSFSIKDQTELGLILLDYKALSAFIDCLFGYAGEDHAEDAFQFGKFSLNIAHQCAQISLKILEQLISEFMEFQPVLSKSTNGIKGINYQRLADKNYQMVFTMTIKQLSVSFYLVFPQTLIEQVVFLDSPKEGMVEANLGKELSNHLINEVVDSTVNLVAVLPEIKLRLSEVLNLKPGNLISIGDPTQVELRVDNKKLYDAHVGQVNSYRVVKTLESSN